MINKYKVLILEDSFEQRLKIKKRLKDFNVLEADCINKATDLYKNNTFDLLLLDQNLPDGLGTEFFKEIVKTPKSYPPVILMTSFGNESFVIDCFHMGFNDYIVKSEEIFILLPEIANRVIRNHRIRTERDELLNKLKIALEKEQRHLKPRVILFL